MMNHWQYMKKDLKELKNNPYVFPPKEEDKADAVKQNTPDSLDSLILYAGAFTKDGKGGRALTIIDPKTKKYEVISRENNWIRSAVPFGNGKTLENFMG